MVPAKTVSRCLPVKVIGREFHLRVRCRRQNRRGIGAGVLAGLILFTVIAGVVMVMLFVAGGAIGYTAIARTLPSPSELSARASAFETVRIYDRDKNLLYSQADPETGNRLYVPLEEISPDLIRATIATEDRHFFENPGFDVVRHRGVRFCKQPEIRSRWPGQAPSRNNW